MRHVYPKVCRLVRPNWILQGLDPAWISLSLIPLSRIDLMCFSPLLLLKSLQKITQLGMLAAPTNGWKRGVRTPVDWPNAFFMPQHHGRKIVAMLIISICDFPAVHMLSLPCNFWNFVFPTMLWLDTEVFVSYKWKPDNVSLELILYTNPRDNVCVW